MWPARDVVSETERNLEERSMTNHDRAQRAVQKIRSFLTGVARIDEDGNETRPYVSLSPGDCYSITGFIEREFAEEAKHEPELLPMQFFVDSINRQNLLLTEIVTELKHHPDRDRFTAACHAMQGMLSANTKMEWGCDSTGESYERFACECPARTAKISAQQADALLAELAKGGNK